MSVRSLMKSAETAAKATEFDNCISVVSELAEAQRRVRDAIAEGRYDFEFRELMNLLEALALLINRGKITNSALEFAEPFLQEAWAYLRADSTTSRLIEESVTGDSTFEELKRFADRHRTRINHLTAGYKEQVGHLTDDPPATAS